MIHKTRLLRLGPASQTARHPTRFFSIYFRNRYCLFLFYLNPQISDSFVVVTNINFKNQIGQPDRWDTSLLPTMIFVNSKPQNLLVPEFYVVPTRLAFLCKLFYETGTNRVRKKNARFIRWFLACRIFFFLFFLIEWNGFYFIVFYCTTKVFFCTES